MAASCWITQPVLVELPSVVMLSYLTGQAVRLKVRNLTVHAQARGPEPLRYRVRRQRIAFPSKERVYQHRDSD